MNTTSLTQSCLPLRHCIHETSAQTVFHRRVCVQLVAKSLSTLSQKSATVAENSETTAKFGDCRTFLRQCGQGLSHAATLRSPAVAEAADRTAYDTLINVITSTTIHCRVRSSITSDNNDFSKFQTNLKYELIMHGCEKQSASDTRELSFC